MSIRNKVLQFQKTLEDVIKYPDDYTPAELSALQNDIDDLMDAERMLDELKELKERIDKLTNEHFTLKAALGMTNFQSFKDSLRGKDGKSVDENKIIETVLSRIPKPKDGKSVNEAAIVARVLSQLPKKNEDKSVQVFLDMWERKLKELYDKLQNKLYAVPPKMKQIGGGGGGSVVQYIDLSASCDGATRVFTITGAARILGVFSTQAPAGAFRPSVDWTFDASTAQLTLSADLPFIAQGQTLYALYVQT